MNPIPLSLARMRRQREALRAELERARRKVAHLEEQDADMLLAIEDAERRAGEDLGALLEASVERNATR